MIALFVERGRERETHYGYIIDDDDGWKLDRRGGGGINWAVAWRGVKAWIAILWVGRGFRDGMKDGPRMIVSIHVCVLCIVVQVCMG